MQSQLSTYAILEPAAFGKQNVCVLVEKGVFYGMGSIPENTNFTNIEKLKKKINQYPENETIRTMIRSYALKHPDKVFMMD
jgi:DNA polymerase-3 subunit epsilon